MWEAGLQAAIETTLGLLDARIRRHLDAGQYHAAVRLLPAESEEWRKLKERTGEYYEGAHGYLAAVATVKTFDIEVRDGVLDVEFIHRIQSPKISAIEIGRLTEGR